VLSGYEIKWRESTAKIPKLWLETYKGEVSVITKESLPTLLESRDFAAVKAKDMITR